MLIFPKIFDEITADTTVEEFEKRINPDFKIWCKTEEQLHEALTVLEVRTPIRWHSGAKPTEWCPKAIPVGVLITKNRMGFSTSKRYYDILVNYYEIRFAEKKPPIGLKPRWVHDGDRIADIKDAITRYIYEKKDIPWEWIDELRDIQTLHGGNITF